MAKYQVWLSGSSLYDFNATSKDDARKQMREYLKVDRLPKGTIVCEVSNDYYKQMVDFNRRSGFNATNS